MTAAWPPAPGGPSLGAEAAPFVVLVVAFGRLESPPPRAPGRAPAFRLAVAAGVLTWSAGLAFLAAGITTG